MKLKHLSDFVETEKPARELDIIELGRLKCNVTTLR